jgi:hypothetical protein
MIERLRDWRTTPELMETMSEVDSGNIGPPDCEDVMDSVANRPTGPASVALTTRKGGQSLSAENRR